MVDVDLGNKIATMTRLRRGVFLRNFVRTNPNEQELISIVFFMKNIFSKKIL